SMSNKRGLRACYPSNKVLLILGTLLIVFLAISWILYLSLGHHLIGSMYNSESISLVAKLMPGRATTPVEAYYQRSDQLLILISFWSLMLVAVVSVLTFAVRQPIGALLTFSSFAITSFVLFSVLELFPSLILRLGLDRIDYYAWKSCCLFDSTLRFRYRPMMDELIPFRGYLYSPIYGVGVPEMIVHLTTDKDGFIHNSAASERTDVAVIGDSFIGDALSETDTFGRRLEAISGLKVANLGVAGYGPFQYLEVLKRYGLPLKPRYALL